MTDIKINNEQRLAINSNYKEILVSASAGTGKTTVLVERVKRLIIENKIPLKKLLIITFTNNSAHLLKERIKKILEKELARNYNIFIEEQLLSIGNSNIFTFHTFFNKVLNKYSNELNISSNFKIVSDNELEILFEESLDKLVFLILKENENNKMYNHLIDFFYQKNNFDIFKKTILKVYLKIRNYKDFDLWINESLKNYTDKNKIEIIWKKICLDNIEVLNTLIAKIDTILFGINFEKFPKHFYFLKQIKEKLINISKDINFDLVIENLKKFKIGTWPRDNKSKEADFTLNKCYNDYLLFKKELNNYIDSLIKKDDFFKEQEQQKKFIKEFIVSIKKFNDIFSEEKLKRNLLDFYDLEILTLKLLLKNKNIRDEISNSITDILIDEYQDTNNIQESIINLLKDKDKNFFMVGDIKQSIYGFRESNPAIFNNKRKKYIKKNNKSILIPLNKNYRSNNDILKFSNLISEHVFSKYSFYDKKIDNFIISEENFLNANNNVKYIFYNEDKNIKYLQQVDAIVNKIKNIIFVEDNIYKNNLNLSDIAIISRRRNKEFLELLQEKLEEENIDYNLDINRNLFKIKEIIDIISMLQILQNVNDDNYLFVFLKSLFCNINDIELYEILKNKKEISLYNKLHNYLLENNSNLLSEKIKKILKNINIYKKIINNIPLSDAILEIIKESYLFEKIANTKNAKNTISNIEFFIQISKDYEKKHNALFVFNNYIKKSLESGYFISSNDYKNKKDALNIITIHKSKGLEFPFVFLIDLDNKFNDVDTKDIFQLDNDYGIAFRLLDTKRRLRYKSIFYRFIDERNRKKNTEEECRLLYVACTRPKNKLYIFLNKNNLNKKITKENFQSFSDIFISIYNNYDLNYDDVFLDKKINIKQPKLLRQEFINKYDNLSIDELKYYEKIIDFKYEKNFLQNYPQKVTVSELNKKDYFNNKTDKEINTDFSILYPDPVSLINNKKLSQTDIGKIYHFILENYSWDNTKIKETISELAEKNKIPEIFTKRDTIEKLNKVVYTIKEKYIKKKYIVVAKEMPFSLLKPAKYIYKNEDRFNCEKIVIQGKVDLLLRKKNDYVIIDFKTSDKKIEHLTREYNIQLTLYKEAIEKKFNCKKIVCEIIPIK